MKRRPIQAGIDAGGGEERREPGAAAEDVRALLSEWASTVTLVAVRDGPDVHAVTVTSFFPVSLHPPLVAVSLGANARPLPWMDPGAAFVVSLLAEGQHRMASHYADALPLGPSPFPAEGPPVAAGCVGALVCSVRAVHETEGGARIVVGRVEDVVGGGAEGPLLYWRRAYRRLAGEP